MKTTSKTMNKDWRGNAHSVFVSLGASMHSASDRAKHDYYATHPIAIDALRSAYDIPKVVCEPCCGEGHLSERLTHFGHKVYSSDLVDRGYGAVKDFLDMQALPDDCNCILTNPPFKLLNKIAKHSLTLLRDGGVLLLFIKTTSLEGLARYETIFKPDPPRFVMPFVGRVVCAKNGNFKAMAGVGSAISYSWFVWEKGYTGNPEIIWLNYHLKGSENNQLNKHKP